MNKKESNPNPPDIKYRPKPPPPPPKKNMYPISIRIKILDYLLSEVGSSEEKEIIKELESTFI